MPEAHVWTLKLRFKTTLRIVKFSLSPFTKADILKCLVCTQHTEEIGKYKIAHTRVDTDMPHPQSHLHIWTQTRLQFWLWYWLEIAR